MRSNKEKKLSERYIDLPENKERYSSLCFICINMPITKIIISANDTPTEERDGNSKYKECKDNKKPCEYCNEKKGVHKYYNGEVELVFDSYRIGYPVDNQIVDMLLGQLKRNGVFKGKRV